MTRAPMAALGALVLATACNAGLDGPKDGAAADEPGDCCDRLRCEAQGRVCSRCTCVDADDDGDGDGWVAGEDCDDTRDDVFPGAEERCNGRDDDCDDRTDEDDCEVGACCAGACVRTDDDPGNCGGCGVDCDDDDPCTSDSCVAGRCANDPCGPGTACCVAGLCGECCGDEDCEDGDPCSTDSCAGGTCAHGDGCGGGERCCDGACAVCCDDDDCGTGEQCDRGDCVCGPAPHWQVVDGECRPSCGAALADAGYANDGSGCCEFGCALRETRPTWDCAHCCETAPGVSACW